MKEKEFYGTISFSGRISFFADAKDKKTVRDLLFESLGIEIKSFDDNLGITEVEWDLIENEPGGNIATPFISDLEILEEK